MSKNNISSQFFLLPVVVSQEAILLLHAAWDLSIGVKTLSNFHMVSVKNVCITTFSAAILGNSSNVVLDE
jgi:hypothetical protein